MLTAFLAGTGAEFVAKSTSHGYTVPPMISSSFETREFSGALFAIRLTPSKHLDLLLRVSFSPGRSFLCHELPAQHSREMCTPLTLLIYVQLELTTLPDTHRFYPSFLVSLTFKSPPGQLFDIVLHQLHSHGDGRIIMVNIRWFVILSLFSLNSVAVGVDHIRCQWLAMS
jgi:hypothetical protein